MHYRILPFLILLSLAGCTLPTPSQVRDMPVNSASDRFAEGMDQYLATGDLSFLRNAAEKDVGGEWGRRAETVIQLDEQVAELNRKIALLSRQVKDLNDDIDSLTGKLEKQQAQLQNKEKQLTQSIETKELLSRDNQILEVTLERLRRALVEVGQQPKE
jgi:phenylalanyl-tRNA synthetase alpha subunit